LAQFGTQFGHVEEDLASSTMFISDTSTFQSSDQQTVYNDGWRHPQSTRHPSQT